MKKIIATLLIASSFVGVTASTSFAFDRNAPHPHARSNHFPEKKHDAGRDAGIAILGAVTGIILNETVRGNNPPPPPPHYRPAPPRHIKPVTHPRHVRPHHTPAAKIRAGEPWSPEWYRFCSSNYRSFNPKTGTYVGYDGVKKFCTVPSRR